MKDRILGDKELTKEEYLSQLQKYLRRLPKQDYEDAMEYFTEYFEDADEAGAADLMADLGTPKEAAREIISNLLDKKMEDPLDGEIDDKTGKLRKGLGKHAVWIAILLILAAPIGVPMILALLLVLAAFLLCLIGVLICIILLSICVIILGGKMLMAGVVAASASISGLILLLGCGLLGIGLGILGLVLTVYLCKWSGMLIVKLAHRISDKSKRKEGRQ